MSVKTAKVYLQSTAVRLNTNQTIRFCLLHQSFLYIGVFARYSRRSRITFNCVMDFHLFPVDTQVTFSSRSPLKYLLVDLLPHLPLLLFHHKILHHEVQEGRHEDRGGRTSCPV